MHDGHAGNKAVLRSVCHILDHLPCVLLINFQIRLWAVLRLQVIPENLGGAGAYRIEWEFDDAVFKEAA